MYSRAIGFLIYDLVSHFDGHAAETTAGKISALTNVILQGLALYHHLLRIIFHLQNIQCQVSCGAIVGIVMQRAPLLN